MAVESVAGSAWNGWPNGYGMPGRMSVEYAEVIAKYRDRPIQSTGGEAIQDVFKRLTEDNERTAHIVAEIMEAYNKGEKGSRSDREDRSPSGHPWISWRNTWASVSTPWSPIQKTADH